MPAGARTLNTAQRVNKTLRRTLDQVKHAVETRDAAIIGVRDLIKIAVSRVAQKQADFVVMLWRADAEKMFQIFTIHRQDQVEGFKVVRCDAPRTEATQVDTTTPGSSLRAGIGRLSHVIGVGSCGVNSNSVSQPAIYYQLGDDAFRRG